MPVKKIAVIDMDNTIFRSSFIKTAVAEFGLKNELVEIVTKNSNPFIRTKMIARLLHGKSISHLLSLTDTIDVTPHLSELIREMKNRGYVTGIISDSYDCITNHIKNKFGFDFTIANDLRFYDGVATGEVQISSMFLPDEKSQCQHEYCKLNALIKIGEDYGVDLKDTLVIGDGENDICPISKAGIGISFCSTDSLVDVVADYQIKEPDFNLLIPLLN